MARNRQLAALAGLAVLGVLHGSLSASADSLPLSPAHVPEHLPAPLLLTDPGGVYTQTVYDLDLLHRHVVRPPDHPTPPGDVFDPPWESHTPPAGAPAIAEYTRQAAPDRTVLFEGADFTAYGGADAGRDTRVWFYTQTTAGNGSFSSAPLLRTVDTTVAAVTEGGTPYGMVAAWVENAAGLSWPVRINATDAWWLGPDHGTTGSTASVYGRNLSYRDGTNTSTVVLRPWGAGAGTASTPCTVVEVNRYRVRFEVPAGLTAGQDYAVWVHNHHGGDYGWSGPLKFRVDAAYPYTWNGTTRNVTSYGAVPNDAGDDTAAIQSAINAASNGDVIYFPAGTYRVRSQVTCSKALSLEGAGSESSIIHMDNASYSGGALFSLTGFPQRTRRLGFTSVKYIDGFVELRGYGKDPTPAGAFVQDCRFEQPLNSDSPALTGGFCRDVVISNCLFVSSRALFMTRPAQVRVTDNTVWGGCDESNAGNGGNGFAFWSPQEMVFLRNFGGSLDREAGYTLRRFMYTQHHYGPSLHAYFGGNETAECGPANNANSGEIMLTEADAMIKPVLAGVSGTTLTFSGVNWTNNAMITDNTLPGFQTMAPAKIVHVRGGPGRGQWRRIVANTANSITIDRPWDVPIDLTSSLRLRECPLRFVFHNNTLDGPHDDADGDGVPNYLEIANAVTGVNLYGSAMDCVVDGNTMTYVRRGVYAGGWSNTGSNLDQAQSGILLRDNRVSGAWQGLFICQTVRPSGLGDAGMGPCVLGTMARDNVISNVQAAVVVDRGAVWYEAGWAYVQNTVAEHNLIEEADTGGRIGMEQDYTVFRSNRINLLHAPAGSRGVDFDDAAERPYLYDNQYGSGLGATYGGTLPGARLELPFRRLDFGPANELTLEVPVRSVEVSNLNWTASSDSAWLAPNPGAGTAAAEGASTLTLTADPSGLDGGTYTGIVTVAGGDGPAQRMTAVLEIGMATNGVPAWWLASHGLTNTSWDAAALDDQDGDTMATWEEYAADTVPTLFGSALRFTRIEPGDAGTTLYWTGGVEARQTLEYAADWPEGDWQAILTNQPPTLTTGQHLHTAAPAGGVYRLRAVRP